MVSRRKFVHKPHRPSKPKESLSGRNQMFCLHIDEYDEIVFTDEQKVLLQNCDGVSTSEYNNIIEFYTLSDLPNPLFEEQMEQYTKDYEKYKEEYAAWKQYDKEEKAGLKAKQEERDRKQYDRLKRKFENA